MEYASYGGVALLSAIISAKWAMDLGFSQGRQVLLGIGGLILGPLIPLVLYIYLLYAAKGSAKKFF